MSRWRPSRLSLADCSGASLFLRPHWMLLGAFYPSTVETNIGEKIKNKRSKTLLFFQLTVSVSDPLSSIWRKAHVRIAENRPGSQRRAAVRPPVCLRGSSLGGPGCTAGRGARSTGRASPLSRGWQGGGGPAHRAETRDGESARPKRNSVSPGGVPCGGWGGQRACAASFCCQRVRADVVVGWN